MKSKEIVLKKGDRGKAVEALQKALGMELTTYGYFGRLTKAKVKAYQRLVGLTQDGKAGKFTLASIGLNLEEYVSTDLTNQPTEVVETSLDLFSNEILREGEYVKGGRSKWFDFWHHTAGAHNPYAVKRMWETDTRGRIGTNNIIGGISLKGDATYDGVILNIIPEGGYCYHLGKNGSRELHRRSTSVELCNYGYLTKGEYRKRGKRIVADKDKFYTYTGQEVLKSQVCDLGFEFRGKRYYHKYTTKQLEALYNLTLFNAKKYSGIDYVGSGLLKKIHEAKSIQDIKVAFEYDRDSYLGRVRGLLTHTNIRPDKSDLSPQPALIEMMKALYNELK